METRLKPMGVREVLDYTFAILRERFWTFQGTIFRAFLVPFILGILLLVFMAISVGMAFLGGQAVNPEFFESFFRNMGAGVAVFVIMALVIAVFVVIGSINIIFAIIKLFKAGLHQEECTVRQSFEGIKGKRGKVVGLFFLSMLLGMLLTGISLLIFGSTPKLWVQHVINLIIYTIDFLFCLVLPIIVLENRRLFESLGRAFRLMSGHRWRVLGTLLLVYLLGYVLYFIMLGIAAGPIILAVAFKNLLLFVVAFVFCLASLLIFNLMMTYFYGPITLIYFDLMIRKEGYDIQQSLQNDPIVQSSEGSISL